MPPIMQSGGVRHCVINPQGTRLATLSDSSTLRLWAIPPALKSNGTLTHNAVIQQAIFCNTNEIIVTLDGNQSVALWKIPSSSVPDNSFPAPVILPAKATAIHLSPCGRYLLLWRDNEAYVWSIQNAQPVGPLFQKTVIATANAVFSPNGNLVALRKGAESISIHESASGKTIGEVPAELSAQIAFSPEGDSLAIGDNTGHIRVLRVTSGEILAETHLREGVFQNLEFSVDGKLLLAGSKSLVQIYHAESLQPAAPPIDHETQIKSVKFSTDENKFLTCLQDGSIRLVGWRDGSQLKSFTPGESASVPILSTLVVANERWIAGFGSDRRYRVIDPETGFLLRPTIFHKSHRHPPSVSPDGKWILTADFNYRRTLWPMNGVNEERSEPWLPDFLEDLSGLRFKADGTCESIERLDVHRLREKYPLAQVKDRSWLPSLLLNF